LEHSTEHESDAVKKKVHVEDKLINMTDYEVSPFGELPFVNPKNNSEASTSIHGDPFLEEEFGEFIRNDNKHKPIESEDPNLDLLMEEGLGNLRRLSKFSSDDLTPKRIRNFGIENSINPIGWEYDCQTNFNLDPF